MNYEHLANNLAIATDGFPESETLNILEWLEEKKLLTIDGLKIKEVFSKRTIPVMKKEKGQ